MKFLNIILIFTMFFGAFMKVEAQPNHNELDKLLKEFVSASGNVNYAELAKQKSKIATIITEYKDAKGIAKWTKDDQLAYYINVYNVHTINVILDHYPVKSIQNIDGGKTWDVKRISINGSLISLNHLENEIIRKNFSDPRIHFAVNCGATSCPPLMNGAFKGANLNSQLERQTKAFINNTKYNTISKTSLKVSKIFDWYGVDFGVLSDFINKYSTTKSNKNASVSYNTYDWSLNGK